MKTCRSFLKFVPLVLVLFGAVGWQASTYAAESAMAIAEVSGVNVNTATAEELAVSLKGVGLKKAQAIVAYREQHGEFSSAEDLLNVKGIGQATLAKNTDKIRLK